jgi:HlyD family secretion protein
LKRLPWLKAALAALAAFLVAWMLVQSFRGPRLDAYRVETRPLVQTVVATGRVVAASRAQVGSAVTGVVLERRVQEGDTVQPGDILAVLRADDLEASVREAEAALAQLEQSTRPQAQAALRQAEAQLTQASREAERRRDLFQRQLIARESMEQAVQAETIARSAAEQARLTAGALAAGNPGETAARERVANARALLAKTTIRAEVAGTVLTRNAEPGDLVQPGRVLFEIARDGNTEILVPMDEKNLEVLALGQAAQSVADAFPARPFPARVSFIAPSIDPARGTVEVRLTVEPVPDFLREDMTVSVNVETGRRESAIVVPNDALGAVAGDRAELWRVQGGKVSRQRVTLGLRGLAMTEITEGLAAGDWILADAQAAVEPGDRVRVIAGELPAAGSDSATRGELPVSLD